MIIESLHIDEWERHVLESCLTIGDVMQLDPGESIDILVMGFFNEDRIQPNILHEPQHFFRYNRATYTRGSSDVDLALKGQMTFHWGGYEDPENTHTEDDFEFDVEYQKDRWYRLKNGILPETDPQGIHQFTFEGSKAWFEFPQDTHVGLQGWMQGSILLWDKLPEMPQIYYGD